MSRRLKVTLIVLALLVPLLALLFLAKAWVAMEEAFRTSGIHNVEWSGMDLSQTSLAFDQFSLVKEAQEYRLSIVADNVLLTIGWRWTGPEVEALDIGWLEVEKSGRVTSDRDGADRTEPEQSDGSTFAELDPSADKPRWLPRQIAIQQFQAELPCEKGRCDLQGSASLIFHESVLPASAQVNLHHQGQVLTLVAEADNESDAGQEMLATVEVNGTEHARLATSWRKTGKRAAAGSSIVGSTGTRSTSPERLWEGELTVHELPQPDWLLTWLQQWWAMPEMRAVPGPDNARVRLSWRLAAPPDFAFFSHFSGDLQLHADLPRAWPLPEVGNIQGHVRLAAEATQGEWSPRTAEADLRLTEPGEWIEAIPESLRPESLELKLKRPDRGPTNGSASLLPVRLKLQGRGNTRWEVDADLGLRAGKPWQVELSSVAVNASATSLNLGEWKLRGAEARLYGTGEASAGKLTMTLTEGSIVSIAHLDGPEGGDPLWLDGLTAELAQLELEVISGPTAHGQGLAFEGPVNLDIRQFRHALFKTQPWSFSGKVNGVGSQGVVTGILVPDAGLVTNLGLEYGPDTGLAVRSGFEAAGETGTQALAATLADWPEDLTISQGRLAAELYFHLPEEGKPQANATLGFEDLSGLYDRAAWRGLNGALELTVDDGRLEFGTDELILAQVNPGVALGPVSLAARYQADTNELVGGQLQVLRATSAILGGQAEVRPDMFNMEAGPWPVNVEINQLNLADLMSIYPAEGLSATGRLNGQLPFMVGPDGVRVKNGRLSASGSGGVLRLPVDRLQAMARDNPAMNLVTEALANFHYSVLDTTIDYEIDGKLTLGLHLKGRNPEIRDGHPLVFNINIEEDVPALLTSLQLSGRVNEAVTRKVRELVRQRETTGD